MRNRILMVLTMILFSMPMMAQDAQKDKKKYSATLTINSDSFFGLTPIAAVGIPLTDTIDLTGYAIFWSGIGNTHSFGHWTEFGGGVNISLMDDALNINPQLGILNGTLLSRGNFGTGGGGPMFNEGIVPNIAIFFDKAGFELELYAGYYMGTRAASGAKTTNAGITEHALVDRDIAMASSIPEVSDALGSVGLKTSYFPNRNARYNYTHYWAFPGYQFTEWFSGGLHWEELRFKPSGGDGDYSQTMYRWTGLYTKFKAGNGSLRFAFGTSDANESHGMTGVQMRNDIVAARQAAPTLTVEQAAQVAYVSWLNSNKSIPQRGTYYRVTYTQTF